MLKYVHKNTPFLHCTICAIPLNSVRKKGQETVEISLYFLLISSLEWPIKADLWYNVRPWDYNIFIILIVLDHLKEVE